MTMSHLGIMTLFLSVACAPMNKFSPTRPAPVPAQPSDYKVAIESWMAPGTKTAGNGWATYEFADTAFSGSDIGAELQSGFEDLCTRFEGRVVQVERRKALAGPDRACTKDGKPIFGASINKHGPSIAHGHYPPVKVITAIIDHYDGEYLTAQREEQERATEAERVRRETDAARSEQLTQEVRANLQPGDVVRVEVESDLVDTETGDRVRMGKKRVEALVLEVKPPLVHVQVSRPVQALWVRIESIHHR